MKKIELPARNFQPGMEHLSSWGTRNVSGRNCWKIFHAIAQICVTTRETKTDQVRFHVGINSLCVQELVLCMEVKIS